ncbi:MAG TPA: hypothetical protein VLB09_09160, partial [Nitrospiria bacterium]|nr:hypothetical protein [Nitrospiria bacterium]
GNFELNVMMPMMAYNLLQSIDLLARSADNLRERCVEGIEADEKRCREMIEGSLAMCTSLAPVIGYDAAAAIAKQAFRTGKTVREVAKAKKVLSAEKLDRLLDPWSMTMPGAKGGAGNSRSKKKSVKKAAKKKNVGKTRKAKPVRKGKAKGTKKKTGRRKTKR